MNVLVTGGAGFIGRWVVNRLLKEGEKVWVLDNLSNGSISNIENFMHKPNFNFIKGDIKDRILLNSLFRKKFDICYHLAASINVQDSLDNPRYTFDNDVVGTFNLLEQCKKYNVRFVYMSTCMVYEGAQEGMPIDETHPVKPASPYASSKISGEMLTLSYYFSYNLPVVILRPFNTYGPYQKSNNEGGVIPIFINNKINNEKLMVFGTGEQTRDFLYVEDCARFVVMAGNSSEATGEVINAGSGKDISINKLALIISGTEEEIKHVSHIHPQSEIKKLLCNYSKARKILNWTPEISLVEGIKRTERWLRKINN